MKKALYILSLGALMFSATGCSDDYLDQTPVGGDTDDNVIFSSLDNVKMAVNGIGLLQTQQYLGTQGFNGEGTIKTWFNEYTGQDYTKCALTGWSNVMNLNYTLRPTATYNYYIWDYCYMQIGNANRIIARIDEVPGNPYFRSYLKAQALVYRAYAYSHLVKYYSRRWSDKQGECRGVVLRLEPTTDAMPATSLKNVYIQIYKDLDDAIALFANAKEGGYDRAADETYLPNTDVAYAVYARAAINRQDWATALKYADLAAKNYPIMGISDYSAGFNKANKEWIWEAYNDASQTLHYYGFFAYNSPNSSASACRNYPIALSRELANMVPSNDSRLALFGIPTEAELTEFQKIAGDGFNTNTGAVTKGKYYKRIKADYKEKLYSKSLIFPYMSFKYQAAGSSAGDGELCLFRAAEMLYTAAEAAYMLDKETEAQNYLKQAVAPYQSGYTCTKKGEELLNEIKLYRRFDLFGEGLSWSDCKRWGIPMVRHTWAEGGNYALQMAGDASVATNGNYGITAKNNWTYCYPDKEVNYNKFVTNIEKDDWKEGDK